jgi:hypothetical protein
VAISAIAAITLPCGAYGGRYCPRVVGIGRHSGYIRGKVADESHARTDEELLHQKTPVMIRRKNGVRSTLGQVHKTVQAPKWWAQRTCPQSTCGAGRSWNSARTIVPQKPSA